MGGGGLDHHSEAMKVSRQFPVRIKGRVSGRRKVMEKAAYVLPKPHNSHDRCAHAVGVGTHLCANTDAGF